MSKNDLVWVAFILERKEVLHDPNYCDFDK